VYTVEFVPAEWLERAVFWPGLLVYSRPVQIERRIQSRRASDVEVLLRSLLSTQVN
jgi:hypothetical protein